MLPSTATAASAHSSETEACALGGATSSAGSSRAWTLGVRVKKADQRRAQGGELAAAASQWPGTPAPKVCPEEEEEEGKADEGELGLPPTPVLPMPMMPLPLSTPCCEEEEDGEKPEAEALPDATATAAACAAPLLLLPPLCRNAAPQAWANKGREEKALEQVAKTMTTLASDATSVLRFS